MELLALEPQCLAALLGRRTREIDGGTDCHFGVGSSVQIRDQLAFQPRDHVFEAQLAFFHALELEFVAARIVHHARDGAVEVAVLGAQLDQLSGDFALLVAQAPALAFGAAR